jgi:hypothetical protein
MSHPSRYDYAYLAAAFNRLSVLSQQQQYTADTTQDASAVAGAAGAAAAAQQKRLGRVLEGRLRQLQADATAAELPVVLSAAVKLGVQDVRFFGGAAAKAVASDKLDTASDTYLASVMFAIASFSSGSGRAWPREFTRQQQHNLLRKCLVRLVQLVEQQQQGPRELAALTAAALAGTASAAANNTVQPQNVIMALWAAAAAGFTPPRKLQMSSVFAYLGQKHIVNQLMGSSSNSSSSSSSDDGQQGQATPSEEVVRTCGTVLWAASQTGFTGDLETLKPYVAAFLDAARAVPVACGSILTVLLSLASLLSEQQQQQEQQPEHAAQQQQQQQQQLQHQHQQHAVDLQYWYKCLVQTSQALISSLQQQDAATAQSVAAAVAPQLLWAFEVTGVTLPQDHLHALQELTGDQVSVSFWGVGVLGGGNQLW